MQVLEIKVPDIGDFSEVTVIELLVKPGDHVNIEQSLITVESDKASMEIPSSAVRCDRKFAYKTFDAIGRYALNRNGARVKRLRSNLSRVCPTKSSSEMDDLMRQAMSSYMRYWCDTFRSPDWSRERIAATVTVDGEDLLTAPMKNGTGVVVALPHAGNWDHAGSYFCGMGFPLVTVAERLKPEALLQ